MSSLQQTAKQSPKQGSPPPGGLYARSATGLVRDISLGSSIAVNVSTIGIGLLILSATQIPSLFPRGSAAWSTVVCGVLMLAPALVYGLFSAALPRTGGDYVFVGRTVHPWAGLFTNVNFTLWYFIALGFLAYFVPQTGLSTVCAVLGVTLHSGTLTKWSVDLTQPGWIFGFGMLTLILCTIAASLRLRTLLKLVGIFFGLSLLGFLVAIFVMLFHSHQQFVSAIHRYGGNYNAIVRAGTSVGYHTGHGTSIGSVFLGSPFVFIAFGYGIATAYTAGEMRSSHKTALSGKVASLLVATVLSALAFLLADHVFGRGFLGSATALSGAGSKAYPFAVPSNFFLFVSMLTSSNVLQIIMTVGFALAYIATLLPTVVIVVRNLFAWSFDRILPERVSDVDERTGAPLIANAIVFVGAAAYLAFMSFGPTTALQTVGAFTLGTLITFTIVAAAAIVFPYRRPDLFKNSAIATWKVGPLPAITVAGLVALPAYVFWTIRFATSNALGANTTTGWVFILAILGISAVAYPIALVINRRRGIDISLSGRELPPE